MKGKYHNYEQEKFNKESFLEGIRKEKEEIFKSIDIKEDEIKQLRIRIKKLEIDLGHTQDDKTNY